MQTTEGRARSSWGRVGAELDTDAGRAAARLAARNALAVARQHLGSLNPVRRVVRLGVMLVADGASDLLQEIFGPEKNPGRLVYGVSSLPLGTPIELELIFEIEE